MRGSICLTAELLNGGFTDWLRPGRQFWIHQGFPTLLVLARMSAPFGACISLDFGSEFGEKVELESFQFITPPIEFRLVRKGVALQEWQAGNGEMYDLQHGPGVKQWSRDGHWIHNDLDHRHDVVTCGVLSKDLVMENRYTTPKH